MQVNKNLLLCITSILGMVVTLFSFVLFRNIINSVVIAIKTDVNFSYFQGNVGMLVVELSNNINIIKASNLILHFIILLLITTCALNNWNLYLKNKNIKRVTGGFENDKNN